MRNESVKEQPSIRKRFFVIGIGFFFLVMVVTSFFGKKGYMDLARSKKSYLILQAEFRQLEEKLKKLELDIDELKKNPMALEKEAREKLWLMKPDEKVLVIKKRGEPSQTLPSHAPTNPGR